MVKQPVLDIDLGFVGVEEAGFDEGDAGHGGFLAVAARGGSAGGVLKSETRVVRRDEPAWRKRQWRHRSRCQKYRRRGGASGFHIKMLIIKN